MTPNTVLIATWEMKGTQYKRDLLEEDFPFVEVQSQVYTWVRNTSLCDDVDPWFILFG